MAPQGSRAIYSIMVLPKIGPVLDFGGSWKVYSPSSISESPHNRCGFDPHYSFALPRPPLCIKRKSRVIDQQQLRLSPLLICMTKLVFNTSSFHNLLPCLFSFYL